MVKCAYCRIISVLNNRGTAQFMMYDGTITTQILLYVFAGLIKESSWNRFLTLACLLARINTLIRTEISGFKGTSSACNQEQLKKMVGGSHADAAKQVCTGCQVFWTQKDYICPLIVFEYRVNRRLNQIPHIALQSYD